MYMYHLPVIILEFLNLKPVANCKRFHVIYLDFWQLYAKTHFETVLEMEIQLSYTVRIKHDYFAKKIFNDLTSDHNF